jgi:feruloyl esterase
LLGGFFDPSAWSSTATTKDSFQERCLAFKAVIPYSRHEFTEHLKASHKAKLSHRDVTCGGPGESRAVSQDLCRVAMYVETSKTSGIHLEAWLPVDWNQRFISTGNGGLGGCR